MVLSDDVFSGFASEYERRRETVLSLQDYLSTCREDPTAYASAPERILAAILKKDHNHEMALAQKESQAAQNLLSAELKAANQTIANQQRQIDHMTAQLDTARKQVAEISVQAVQAGAGKQAADMAREIAIAQAAGNGPQKKG